MPAVIVASIMVVFMGPGMLGIVAHDNLGFPPFAAWIVGILAVLIAGFFVFAVPPWMNFVAWFALTVPFAAFSLWSNAAASPWGIPYVHYFVGILLVATLWGGLAMFASWFWQATGRGEI